MPNDNQEQLAPVSRDWLEHAINFALRHKVFMPMVGPRRARWKDDGESKMAAQAIVDHLELCGVKLTRKVTPMVEPASPHSPYGPGERTK